MKKIVIFSMFFLLSLMPVVNVDAQVYTVKAETTAIETTSAEISPESESNKDEGRKPNVNILFNEVILQILATIFLFFLIKKTAWKKISLMIEERQNHINGAINDADNKQSEASKLKKEQEKELSDLRSKKKTILDETKNQAKTKETEIVEEAKQKARDIIEKANNEIKQQEKDVQTQLSKELAQMSVNVAEKFLAKEIDESQESDLINQALKEIENAK